MIIYDTRARVCRQHRLSSVVWCVKYDGHRYACMMVYVIHCICIAYRTPLIRQHLHYRKRSVRSKNMLLGGTLPTWLYAL